MSESRVNAANLGVLLDWLWLSESSSWTCPSCGSSNSGAYRLDCKYCNDGRHPMADVLLDLWRADGREVDAGDYAPHELAPPSTWDQGEGFPRRKPPQVWREYVDKFAVTQ